MPTKEDLIKEIDKEYTKARQEYGATAQEIFTSLKNQVVKENINAINLQIKLDNQMPAEKHDDKLHLTLEEIIKSQEKDEQDGKK